MENNLNKSWKTSPGILEKIPFVATEKVHGANFSCIITQNQINYGRRRSVLRPGESFMGAPQNLNHPSKDALFSLLHRVEEYFNFILEEHLDTSQPILEGITLFGELFGGYYPHLGVCEPCPNVPAVQKGVAYSPNLEFLAFDISPHFNGSHPIFYGEDEHVYAPRFMEYSAMKNICEATEIQVVPEIARGSLKDLIKIDPVFKSKIPDLLGLPSLPEDFAEIGLAEGIVIRPLDLRSIETHPRDGRLMLKHKRPGFEECNKIASQKEKQNTKMKPESIFKNHVKSEIKSKMNRSRIEAAASKVGWPTISKEENKKEWTIMVKDIAKEMTADIIEDFSPFPESAGVHIPLKKCKPMELLRNPFNENPELWENMHTENFNYIIKDVLTACINFCVKMCS